MYMLDFRNHPSKSIIKQLIDLTVAWFEIELQTQEAIQTILPKKQ